MCLYNLKSGLINSDTSYSKLPPFFPLGSESEYDSEYESGDSSGSEDDRDRSMDSGNHSADHYAYPGRDAVATPQQARKAQVTLSPSSSEFQASIQSMICYFEDTVSK